VVVEEPPTVTLGGVSPIVTDAEPGGMFGGMIGVADGGMTAVDTGVFVEIGILVLVGTGTGVFVPVGMAGKLAGFPGKVREFNSWILLNPSLSESRFSIAPKAAVFLPLDL
jgi:hypothetical protein